MYSIYINPITSTQLNKCTFIKRSLCRQLTWVFFFKDDLVKN